MQSTTLDPASSIESSISLPTDPLQLNRHIDKYDSTTKNAVTSIRSLPSELLLDLFGLVLASMSRKTHSSWSTISYYRDLNMLRLVCSTWFNLIDYSPELWVFIDPFTPEELWRTALRKSQTRPIEVYCRARDRTNAGRLDESFIQELYKRIQRVALLQVTEGDLHDLGVRGCVMPGLSSLHIVNDNVGTSQAHSPAMSLNQWAPNVRHVKLSCSFNWPNPGWRNLESLEISRFDTRTDFTVLEILNILSVSPTLQNLQLHAEIEHSDPAGVQLPRIHLPALKTFYLTSWAVSGSFDLLESIIASPREEVYLYLSVETVNPGRLRELARRYADGMKDRSTLSLSLSRPGLDATVKLGGFSMALIAADPLKIIRGVREIIEGLGGRLLNAVEHVDLRDNSQERIPTLISAVQSHIQMIRSIHLQSRRSNTFFTLSSEFESGWLFRHLSRISVLGWNQGDVGWTLDVVKARAEAYSRGLIAEKLCRVELSMPSDYVMQNSATQKFRELVPEFVLSRW